MSCQISMFLLAQCWVLCHTVLAFGHPSAPLWCPQGRRAHKLTHQPDFHLTGACIPYSLATDVSRVLRYAPLVPHYITYAKTVCHLPHHRLQQLTVGRHHVGNWVHRSNKQVVSRSSDLASYWVFFEESMWVHNTLPCLFRFSMTVSSFQKVEEHQGWGVLMLFNYLQRAGDMFLILPILLFVHPSVKGISNVAWDIKSGWSSWFFFSIMAVTVAFYLLNEPNICLAGEGMLSIIKVILIF